MTPRGPFRPKTFYDSMKYRGTQRRMCPVAYCHVECGMGLLVLLLSANVNDVHWQYPSITC